MLATIESELCASKGAFRILSPGPVSTLRAGTTVARVAARFMLVKGIYKKRKAGASVATIVGAHVGMKAVLKTAAPVQAQILKAHLHVPKIERDFFRKNGMGGRSWIDKPGVYDMVIIFHDANRAGPHIDVHIGRLSLIYRVKPELYSQLRYNREGYLTEDSRKAIIAHVQSEIATGSRVPQNLDHSYSNARASWVGGDTTAKTYGSGATRQIVSTSKVDIYKAFADGPIELYSPVLNPTRSLYLYRIYPGDGTRAPICIFGEKNSSPPRLEDRLHLKMVHPYEQDKLMGSAEMATSTAKYDGSSCYLVITPNGTTVWSPRVSKTTGRQIEYTHTLRGVHMVTNGETIVAMGEVLFREPHKPWQRQTKNHYLPSSAGSGLLNSHGILPDDVTPEIRIYRVDRVGRTSTVDLPFWENRELQERVAALDPRILKVVELMAPEEALREGFEGVVAVPPHQSVNDGWKLKWWDDPNDWRIDEVGFYLGDKGGVACVVYATSLDSGRSFKLGPGQVGSRELTEDMMAHPADYEGAVLKVLSKQGHEGRAAKAVALHDDKGVHVLSPH